MAKSKKAKNIVDDEMAEIYAEIEQGRKELNEEKIMEEVKTTNEMVAVEDAPLMRVPQAVEVKQVPDEALEVYNLIKQGYTKAEIRTMNARWKQKKFNAVWERAQNIVAQSVCETEEARAVAICRYTDLFKQAQEIGNIKEAKNILDSLCKVQGLNRDVTLNAEFVTVWKQ
jgi:hypothetical protein